jgi:hypothetical protein
MVQRIVSSVLAKTAKIAWAFTTGISRGRDMDDSTLFSAILALDAYNRDANGKITKLR